MSDVIEALTKSLVKGSSAPEAVAPFGSGSLQALGRLFIVCASGPLGRCEQQNSLPADELLVEEGTRARPFDEAAVDYGMSCTSQSTLPPLERGEGCEWARPFSPCSFSVPSRSMQRRRDYDQGGSALEDLVGQGPYFLVAQFLDAEMLNHVDATCRTLRDAHRANCGAWYNLGAQAFLGLELDGEGTFVPSESLLPVKSHHLDWKGRYARFLMEMRAFREPFSSAEITQVHQADEIAYSRILLRTETLDVVPHRGVYIEVEVLANPDNVSLAVVNFDAGGCSSVTFSPDTGAVIRERKVCEEPRKVQGSYIQPLATITQGQGFEGMMGLYLCAGQLSFFRRHLEPREEGMEPQLGGWESTGFITDLEWAEGRPLTPCLAFRDEGAYHVRLTHVGSTPPLVPGRTAMAYEEANWADLNWDADQEQDDDDDAEELAEL